MLSILLLFTYLIHGSCFHECSVRVTSSPLLSAFLLSHNKKGRQRQRQQHHQRQHMIISTQRNNPFTFTRSKVEGAKEYSIISKHYDDFNSRRQQLKNSKSDNDLFDDEIDYDILSKSDIEFLSMADGEELSDEILAQLEEGQPSELAIMKEVREIFTKMLC